MKKQKQHPLNAEGDFFVEYDMCLACDAPYSEAPELIEYDKDMHCYFKRQPHTPEEVEHAINAVRVSCIEAVLYKGNDTEILKRIQEMPCSVQTEKSPTSRQQLFDKILKIFR